MSPYYSGNVALLSCLPFFGAQQKGRAGHCAPGRLTATRSGVSASTPSSASQHRQRRRKAQQEREDAWFRSGGSRDLPVGVVEVERPLALCRGDAVVEQGDVVVQEEVISRMQTGGNVVEDLVLNERVDLTVRDQEVSIRVEEADSRVVREEN